jgi:LAO/AO transport system kinase
MTIMKSIPTYAPEWVPEGMQDDPHFACRVMPGVMSESSQPMHPKHAKRRKLTLDDYERGVLAGDMSILSRAITLVESNHPTHEALAQELLTRLLPKTGNSIRVGITAARTAGQHCAHHRDHRNLLHVMFSCRQRAPVPEP